MNNSTKIQSVAMSKMLGIEDLPDNNNFSELHNNIEQPPKEKENDIMENKQEVMKTNSVTLKKNSTIVERTWPTTPYEITPSGIYKNLYNEGDRTVSELIMTRKMFVEAFVEYILKEDDPEIDEVLKEKLKEVLFK